MINIQKTILELLNQKTGSNSLYRPDAEKISANPVSQYIDVTRNAANSGEQIINFTSDNSSKKNSRQNDYSFKPLTNNVENNYKNNVTSPIGNVVNQIMSVAPTVIQSNYSGLNPRSNSINSNNYGLTTAQNIFGGHTSMKIGQQALSQTSSSSQAFGRANVSSQYKDLALNSIKQDIPSVFSSLIPQTTSNNSYQSLIPQTASNNSYQSLIPQTASNNSYRSLMQTPNNRSTTYSNLEGKVNDLSVKDTTSSNQTSSFSESFQEFKIRDAIPVSKPDIKAKSNPMQIGNQTNIKSSLDKNIFENLDYGSSLIARPNETKSVNTNLNQNILQSDQGTNSNPFSDIMGVSKNLYGFLNSDVGSNSQDNIGFNLNNALNESNYSQMNGSQLFAGSMTNVFNSFSGMSSQASTYNSMQTEQQTITQGMNPNDFINNAAQLIPNFRVDGNFVQQSSEQNKQISQKPKVIMRKTQANRPSSQAKTYKPADGWDISNVPDPTPNLGSLASQLFCTFI